MRLFPRKMLSLKCKKFLVDALRNQKSEISTDRIYHGFDKKKKKKDNVKFTADKDTTLFRNYVDSASQASTLLRS